MYILGSGELRFEWDPQKDRSNQRKHGVSFAEGCTAFSDDHALLIGDPDHSEEEERFILLGLSARLRLLVVCHCHRQADCVIRLISARRASRREGSQYERRRAP